MYSLSKANSGIDSIHTLCLKDFVPGGNKNGICRYNRKPYHEVTSILKSCLSLDGIKVR